MHYAITFFSDFFYETLLNWLFPASSFISKIERLDPSTFRARVQRADVSDLPENIQSLFKYHDPLVRKAIWALKYKGNKKIAKLFAMLLSDILLEDFSDAMLFTNTLSPIIIPIPVSHERRQERGWNQVELIVQELIKYCPHCELDCTLLEKIKHTVSQTKFSRKKRLENLKDCFAVSKQKINKIKNKTVILIDDVTTTGSTLLEARKTLLNAGAKNVLAFTIAH